MKVYLSANRSSRLVHIALNESGVSCEIIPAFSDRKEQKLAEFLPHKFTPSMLWDDSENQPAKELSLMQSHSICRWISETGTHRLLPEDPEKRYLILNHIEKFSLKVLRRIHWIQKGINRKVLIRKTGFLLRIFNKSIGEKQFIFDDQFTLADVYMYTALASLEKLGFQLDRYPNLQNYFEGLKLRPNIQRTHLNEKIMLRNYLLPQP